MLFRSYKTMIDKDSMYNTPPCWCIYMLGLVLDWLEEQGGIPGMEAIKHKKAQMLYDVIDSSRLFTCAVEPGSRSDMNVVFRTGSDELDAKFVQESVAAGFTISFVISSPIRMFLVTRTISVFSLIVRLNIGVIAKQITRDSTMHSKPITVLFLKKFISVSLLLYPWTIQNSAVSAATGPSAFCSRSRSKETNGSSSKN